MNFEGNIGPTDQMHCASYLRCASDMAGQTSLAEQERQCRTAADYVRRDAGKSRTCST
jgi:hypothetical protein